ncbi:ATP phosphoribosyltransferase regulatory subunit [Paenibacillus pectinilyticus]|uniref:ATP phosphoribosyltransferase regulatory subunit n=1 Tax=Paenibacillus pectinilyticus TaxID=512399 RepID=A0A1C1A5D9_9BACL|nr:ATP phosphoribosyltransferase regulatory subunit [Paenibacillus pectinilyticus]OCT15780.1 ATP phosphoribosyltransferase regulatory subunit [Paenibacillus pectinilyticus]
MSKPKVFEKPLGVKDYLPDAVAKLRNIEFRVLACMERWGYNQIITPTLEYYDTVGVASSTEDKKLFKLLDRKGKTLVLRSELTAPIARVASSLLKEQAFPIRLSYHSNVFRSIEEEAGRDSEFYQTGVELIGDASSEADAEVVALAIASLQAAGVEKFKIALGHVGFLNGLFQETLDGRTEDQLALKEHLLSRDYVGYREAIKSLSLAPDVDRELNGVLRLRGGDEICEQARMVSQHPIAQDAIRHLCEVWDVLKAYGVSEHVVIDLTMIGDFSYYTGMTFEGYAADLGFPVCSGGRYDNLLSQFGRPAPATGFALKTNRILEVTGKDQVDRPSRVLIAYDAEHREEALQLAKAMRTRDEAVAVITQLVSETNGQQSGEVGTGYQEVIRLITE